MARAEDISDAFDAEAQLQRRNILNYLAMQESSVADIVDAMELGNLPCPRHLKD